MEIIMTFEKLGGASLVAILAGSNVTLWLPKNMKFPNGWPRGELLCVGEFGANYSFNPLRILGYVQKAAKLNNEAQPLRQLCAT